MLLGTFKSIDGAIYDGTFANGIWDGVGSLHSSNGDVYKGEFKNGQFHGKVCENILDCH